MSEVFSRHVRGRVFRQCTSFADGHDGPPTSERCFNLALCSDQGIPPAVRDELIRYLLATSQQRAHIIGELMERNPGIGELLMDLEADDDLRAWLEMTLLRG